MAAQELLERAVALARRANDVRRVATALHALGLVLREQNRPTEALQLAEEVVRLAETTGDLRLLAGALLSQGTLLRDMGRAQESALALERAQGIVSCF